MKIYNRLIIMALAFLMFNACKQNYIDEISELTPGVDETAPSISITFPNDDIIIPFTDVITDVNFKFEVTDDIELKSFTVSLNGLELVSYSDFKDYRRALEAYQYKDLPIGMYNLQVTATDLAGKSTTKNFDFEVSNKYVPKYNNETFYMPFEGQLYMDLISETNATVVGSPGFVDGKIGKAYAGAADSYLTFPIDGITGSSFSAVLWYKVNASPDRAGILNVSIPGEDRTKGFRLFREGSASAQRIKLNVGTGTGETWNNGQEIAAPATDWVHIAFTVSATNCIIYINGAVAADVATTGIDWTGCETLSIGSGAPNFTYWGHSYDLSLYDELRLFNKALSQTEIQAIIDAESPAK